jgi:hypothetical protein
MRLFCMDRHRGVLHFGVAGPFKCHRATTRWACNDILFLRLFAASATTTEHGPEGSAPGLRRDPCGPGAPHAF